MKATYFTDTPQDTFDLGVRFARHLRGGDTVLLYGDLGAGKTLFCQGVAHGLGVTMKVKSPTFAYVNTYPLKKHHMLYHYDLYRLNEGDDVTSLGFDESVDDPNAVNLVEWADRLTDTSIPPYHITVKIAAKGGRRAIDISYVDDRIYSEEVIQSFYDDWATPIHVRAHCAQVANVAIVVGKAFADAGRIVNMNLLYASAKLHDLCRVCDFMSLEEGQFSEEITDEKWAKWVAQRQTYQSQHHGQVAADYLAKAGFPDLAETIRTHKSSLIVEEPQAFDSLEKKILYYADKRSKHDQIVPLKERFADFKERYKNKRTPEADALYAKVEKATYALERELFKDLNIEPKDIV